MSFIYLPEYYLLNQLIYYNTLINNSINQQFNYLFGKIGFPPFLLVLASVIFGCNYLFLLVDLINKLGYFVCFIIAFNSFSFLFNFVFIFLFFIIICFFWFYLKLIYSIKQLIYFTSIVNYLFIFNLILINSSSSWNVGFILSVLIIIFSLSNVIILLYFICIVIFIGFEWMFYNCIEITLLIDLIYLSALLCLFLMSGFLLCSSCNFSF